MPTSGQCSGMKSKSKLADGTPVMRIDSSGTLTELIVCIEKPNESIDCDRTPKKLINTERRWRENKTYVETTIVCWCFSRGVGR